MPSFLTICEDIAKCMCSNSGEVSPEEYFARPVRLPARDVSTRPSRQARPLNSPDPSWAQNQQNDTSPGGNGPPTVLLVPKREQQDPGKSYSKEGSQAEEQTRNSAPQAKPRALTQAHLRELYNRDVGGQSHRVISRMYKPEDPSVKHPSPRAGSGGPDHAGN